MSDAMNPVVRFKQVYADAVIDYEEFDASDMGQQDLANELDVAYGTRQLTWKGDRVPLPIAAKMYATICDGYNEFQPNMLSDLQAAFCGNGIDVTPGRENSVVVYLHFPAGDNEIGGNVRTFIEDNWGADEIDWQADGSLRIWWD